MVGSNSFVRSILVKLPSVAVELYFRKSLIESSITNLVLQVNIMGLKNRYIYWWCFGWKTDFSGNNIEYSSTIGEPNRMNRIPHGFQNSTTMPTHWSVANALLTNQRPSKRACCVTKSKYLFMAVHWQQEWQQQKLSHFNSDMCRLIQNFTRQNAAAWLRNT